MKKSSSFPLAIITILSLFSLIPTIHAGEKLPTKSMFCMALFNQSSQAIPAKQDENIQRWPIQTLESAENFLKEKVYATAIAMPEKRTLKEKILGLTTDSQTEQTYENTDLQSTVAYDTRQNGPSNTSYYLNQTTATIKQLATARLTLESKEPRHESIVIGATEFRGREAILQFIDKVSEESKMWQDQTRKDFTKIDSKFSKHQKFLYAVNSSFLGIIGLGMTSMITTPDPRFMDYAYFIGFLLYEHQTIYNGFKFLGQSTHALVNQNALNNLNNESWTSSKKEQNFLDEISFILNKKSPWNPDLDFIHLGGNHYVTPELAQVVTFGSVSKNAIKKQIVQHANERHSVIFTPEHYWSLGYTLSFAYIPKNIDPSMNSELTTSSSEVEPTLIVTTRLLKNDKKPPTPKKPKEKEKTAIEEAAEGEHGLAPVRY